MIILIIACKRHLLNTTANIKITTNRFIWSKVVRKEMFLKNDITDLTGQIELIIKTWANFSGICTCEKWRRL